MVGEKECLFKGQEQADPCRQLSILIVYNTNTTRVDKPAHVMTI